MALLPARFPERPARGDNAGAHLRGEDPLSEAGDPTVELRLPLSQAQRLHDLLEDALEVRPDPEHLRLLRLLSWRILATREGSSPGLTGRLSELARLSPTLESFEAARDEELGPLLDALEDNRNRDP